MSSFLELLCLQKQPNVSLLRTMQTAIDLQRKINLLIQILLRIIINLHLLALNIDIQKCIYGDLYFDLLHLFVDLRDQALQDGQNPPVDLWTLTDRRCRLEVGIRDLIGLGVRGEEREGVPPGEQHRAHDLANPVQPVR